MNYIDDRVSVKQTIKILARNGILVNENEANTILDFLYLMAKTYNKNNGEINFNILKEKSNYEKVQQVYSKT